MASDVLSRAPSETRALGRRAGERLRAGDVLLLVGELGSGKTTFVKGVAEACGVTAEVRSPTFALVHRYRGRVDLFHVDLYREREAPALDDLGWDAAKATSMAMVEWPRSLGPALWPDARTVTFEHVDATTRRVSLPDGL